MSAIFIKYKTSNRHRILFNLTDKINLKRRSKYVALLNLILYYSVKYANNKLKISCPTQNEKIKLPDGSYSVSDIPDYFGYMIKKHEKLTDNPQ